MTDPKTHTCQCGYAWRSGLHGGHSCSEHYKKRISELQEQLKDSHDYIDSVFEIVDYICDIAGVAKNSISGLAAWAEARGTIAIRLYKTEDWREDNGHCLFFHFPSFEEPPGVFCTSPLDCDFDAEMLTHFIKDFDFNGIIAQAEKERRANSPCLDCGATDEYKAGEICTEATRCHGDELWG